MNQQNPNAQTPMPQQPPEISEALQTMMEQNVATGEGTPTPQEIRQNRINLMRSQQAESNVPFDPELGTPIDDPNQGAQQNPFEQVTPPTPNGVPQTMVAPQPTPAPNPNGAPQTLQQVHAPPVQVQQPNGVPQTQIPAQPPANPQQQVPGQPAVDPNAQPAQPGQQPPVDPALVNLTPEEQQTLQNLQTLMGEESAPATDPNQLTPEQMQGYMLQLANQQNQILAMLQNPQQSAMLPPAQPTSFQPPADPNEPFAWNTTPPAPAQPAVADPTQQLMMHTLTQLGEQVKAINTNLEQNSASQQREAAIQEIMTTRGIGREYAEKAQDFFDKGESLKGSQILELASAPVIARMQATQERDVRRDAAGQPLTPAPQGGVRTTPDEMQAIQTELTQILAQPRSEQKKLNIINWIQKYPQYAHMVYGQQPQTAPLMVNT